jgi:hypothetical protein
MHRRCAGGCRHGLGAACLAVRAGNWHLCELADPAHPGFRPEFVGQLAAGLEFQSEPAAGGASIDPVLLAIDLCEFRAGCACKAAYRCLQAGYPAMTSRERCSWCVTAGPSAP